MKNSLSTLLFALLATTSIVSSLELRGGRRLDSDETDRDYECEMSTKANERVEFECKSEVRNRNVQIENKIKFKLSQDNRKGLKIKVEYEEETEMESGDEDNTDEEEPDENEEDEMETADDEEDEDGGEEERFRRRRRNNRRNLQTVEETEVETSYEVVFGEIIEYRKPSGSDGSLSRRLSAVEQAYDWENDEVISRLSLSDWTGFTDVQTTRRRLQSGMDGTVYQFSLSTFDGVARFDFTIAQASGPNVTVSDNKMKIDVTLTDYPLSSPDSYLALVSSVESEREVEIEYADEDDEDEEEDDVEIEVEDESETEDGGDDVRRNRRRLSARESKEVIISFDDALQATNIRPFGEFTWATEAVAFSPGSEDPSFNVTDPVVSTMQTDLNGYQSKTIQVIGTAPQDGSDRLAFSFVGNGAQNASVIYWDPETGISYSTRSSALGLSTGIALVTTATFAVFGMLL